MTSSPDLSGYDWTKDYDDMTDGFQRGWFDLLVRAVVTKDAADAYESRRQWIPWLDDPEIHVAFRQRLTTFDLTSVRVTDAPQIATNANRVASRILNAQRRAARRA